MTVVAPGLPKGHVSGTHRLVSPELTLARIAPHLAAMEITRCADITGLDRLGIPVFCAVRPRGHILQTTNGKGLRPMDAKVSALMEAVEHFHAEAPAAGVVRASAAEMARAGRVVVRPESLPGYRADVFFDDRFRIEWLSAEELHGGAAVFLPASAVQISSTPMLFRFSANGLASGNHPVEATLHALYEVIERDAIASLSEEGRLRLGSPYCRFLRVETIGDPAVAGLVERVRAAGLRIVLLSVRARVAVPTLWAVLLDPGSPALHTRVNVGYGSHLDAGVAAIRAITEAAQSRSTYIHGAREDLAFKMTSDRHRAVEALYRFFADAPPGDLDWRELETESSSDLAKDYEHVLRLLADTGLRQVFRADLTSAPFEIPVVKVIVPGLAHDRRFF